MCLYSKRLGDTFMYRLTIRREFTMAQEAAKAEVKWGTSIEEAMKQSAETGKPIMMDFYTDS